MERNDALQFYEMYKLQKEYGRNVYPEELRGHNICPGSKIESFIARLLDLNAIIEENVQGANTYRVTRTGIAQLEAYPDIRRELQKDPFLKGVLA